MEDQRKGFMEAIMDGKNGAEWAVAAGVVGVVSAVALSITIGTVLSRNAEARIEAERAASCYQEWDYDPVRDVSYLTLSYCGEAGETIIRGESEVAQ